MFSSYSWITDTGVTHHVTGQKSWLFDLVDITACLVGLLNGADVIATQTGNVRLSAIITLHDVLYVPTFS